MDVDEAKIPSILSTQRMKPVQSWYMRKTYRHERALHIHSYGKSSDMGEERLGKITKSAVALNRKLHSSLGSPFHSQHFQSRDV